MNTKISEDLEKFPTYFKSSLKTYLEENIQTFKNSLKKTPIIIYDNDFQVSIKSEDELREIIQKLNEINE